MESWTLFMMWVAVPAFFVFVLLLAASPKDTRNLGEGRGGSSPLQSFTQALGQGVLDAQALVEPDKRHLVEEMRRQEVQAEEEGGPKDPTSRHD
jgi:hypothetical protein